MDGWLLTPRKSGEKRLTAAKRNLRDAAKFRVNGEYVTRREIARRTHHGTSWVSKQLRALRTRREAMTWGDFQ